MNFFPSSLHYSLSLSWRVWAFEEFLIQNWNGQLLSEQKPGQERLMYLEFLGFLSQPLILFFFVWDPRGPSEVILAPEYRDAPSCSPIPPLPSLLHGPLSPPLRPICPAPRVPPHPGVILSALLGLSRGDCSDGLLAPSLPKLTLGSHKGCITALPFKVRKLPFQYLPIS